MPHRRPRLRDRLRSAHATVVVYLALFAAVAGGTAYAAGTITGRDIARDAVDSRHLAPRAVDRGHVARAAIDSSRIANRSIRATDMAQAPNGRMSRSALLYFDTRDPNLVTFEQTDFGAPAAAFAPRRGSFIAPQAGTYLLTGTVDWAPAAAARTLTIRRDYRDELGADSDTLPDGGPVYTQQVVAIARLGAGKGASLWVSGDGRGNGETRGATLSAAFVGG